MTRMRPFLLDIDKNLNYCFVNVTEENLGHANFLERGVLEFDPNTECKIPMIDYQSSVTRSPASFIFHTAFCGSTLMSRALHSPPDIMALKEPNVLYKLSQASITIGDKVLNQYLDTCLAELSHPWTKNGQVIIKPTNSCNRIISSIVTQDNNDSVLLMYSSLEEFLVSCLKKMPASMTRINWMARHLLPGSDLERNCEIPRDTDFSIIEACVLVWFVSLEYFTKAIESMPNKEWLIIDYATLKRNPVPIIVTVGQHFKLADTHLNEASITEKLRYNSKDAGARFSRAKQQQANAVVQDTYGELIKLGLHWAETYVAKNISISNKFKSV